MEEKTRKEVINERFLDIVSALKYRGLVKNDSDFAKKIGLNSSQISNIRTVEGKNVTISIIESMLRAFPQVNSEYIFTGKGCKIFDEMQSKSTDNGAFGGEVERLLRENQELKAKEEKYLEIIRNLSLGKVEGIDSTPEDVIEEMERDAARMMSESISLQLEEVAYGLQD